MQLTAEVRRGNVRNPRSVTTKDMIMEYKIGKDDAGKMTKEEVSKKAKAKWAGMVGTKKSGKDKGTRSQKTGVPMSRGVRTRVKVEKKEEIHGD